MWEVVAVAHGALTGSATVERGVWEVARRLSEEWPSGDEASESAAPLVEETEIVLAWLERPGTRLLMVEGEWTSPVGGAGKHAHWITAQREDHSDVADVVGHRGA